MKEFNGTGLKVEKNILIVEDDKTVLRTFKNILESEGYIVETAETGKEALEKSKARYYNLALLDIRLPDMNGTELLTKLHKDTPRMMKIIITGYPSLENAVEAVNKGADAYIIKPVDSKKLLKVVREKLRKEGIPLIREVVGGNVGRSVEFDTTTGIVTVRVKI